MRKLFNTIKTLGPGAAQGQPGVPFAQVIVPGNLLSTNVPAEWGLATAVPNVAPVPQNAPPGNAPPAPPRNNQAQPPNAPALPGNNQAQPPIVPPRPVADPSPPADNPSLPVDPALPVADPAPEPIAPPPPANRPMANIMPTG